jgi:hypothetical protein
MPTKTALKANKRLTTDEFKALQRLWYAKAKASGFEDIEEDPDRTPEGQNRMLKDYHGTQFCRQDIVKARQSQAAYQERIDNFRNDPAFPEVCKLVTKHKLCKLTASDAQLAWTMHCQGRTEREIAKDLYTEQTVVHRLIARMREWMRLL